MGSSSPKEEEKPKQNETDGNLILIQENKPLKRLQEQAHHHKIKIEKLPNESEITKQEKEEEKKEEKEKEEKIIKLQNKKEEEEKIKKEEEKKIIEEEDKKRKEQIKQSILRKIMEEDIVMKIKLSNEEFINYIIKFFDDLIQIFYSIPKKNL